MLPVTRTTLEKPSSFQNKAHYFFQVLPSESKQAFPKNTCLCLKALFHETLFKAT